jgi:acetylornithine deacetylase/succinyl-diaminopimelate desuccinylase-like protein
MALLCQPYNLPAVTIGAGHADDRVHGVDENIYIADYVQAIACFVEILRQFGA